MEQGRPVQLLFSKVLLKTALRYKRAFLSALFWGLTEVVHNKIRNVIRTQYDLKDIGESTITGYGRGKVK